MARRGINRALTRDLAETALGGLILRFLIPLFAVAYGGLAIFRGQIPIRSTVVQGTPAYWYGAAFVVLGLTVIGYPTIADIRERRVSRFTAVRMKVGWVLFGVLMTGAVVSLF
jgi:hypothetical protein